MKKREADFSILFRHWLRANPMRQSCTFEMKDTRGKEMLPFSAVEPHQLVYMDSIMTSPKGVLIRVQGTNGEPDYIYLYRDPTYIVVKYPDCFCIIQYAHFVDEKESSKRKSLTVERARQIAWHVVDLKKK